jgi:L-arabinonolactonase
MRDAAPMSGAPAATVSATVSATASAMVSAAAPGLAARRGQSLQWDRAALCWWWAGGATGTVQAWSPDGAHELRRVVAGEAGGFALCASGRLLVCQPKRLCFVTVANTPGTPNTPNTPKAPRGWRLRSLCAVDPAEPRTSIHEGRTDRRGFFVFGTRNDGVDARPIGSFYQYSSQYGLRRLALPAVTVATGIGFSVDGRRLYFADGANKRILQCDYDCETAGVANVRLFAGTDGFPEACVIDSEDHLWSAQAGAGRLVRYAPDGSVLRQFALPPGAPASPAFGGVACDQLMVASWGGLIGFPQAGVTGLHDAPFDDG